MIAQVLDFLPLDLRLAIVGAFSAWLGKVWAIRISTKERQEQQKSIDVLRQDLKTVGSKEVFVHRLQFEKEFEIYTELWKEVRRLGLALVPFQDFGMASGVSHQTMIEELVESADELNNRVYDHCPFYAPEIYEHAKELLSKARLVLRLNQDGRPTEQWAIEKSEQAITAINDELVPAVRDGIRWRVFSKKPDGTS